ncbi:unnamed protein product [Clavelina lepadiformis]|uniref:Uncharacterized protein n=1 Tax=Clavelina lepadiformis TaxID=159417 RepID=A0ABP0FM26_CLALP
MIKRDGRGHSYCAARGEILGSAQDEQLRKHLPRMFSLIKSESQRCSGPHARYTDRISVCSPWPKGLGNPLNPGRARDRELQLFPLNEEFPVSVGEPAEGSLSKRTEAPARVAAASPGNRPPLALVEVKTRPLRRSTRHKSFTGDTLSIDVLNANCGLGLIPGPRPPQGRLKSNPGAHVARANAESDGDLCLRRPVEVSKGPARDRRARRRRIDLEEVSSFRQVAAIDRERRRSSARVTSLTFRPEVGRDYPLNLSILLSGGKETNEDSLKFVLRASRIARVLLIEASSHSGCQAHGGDSRACSASSRSRVVWECSPKRVANGRACRVALALSAAAGLITAESRTLTGRIPPVHGRGQRTSAGREPRPAGRRSEGRAQGNSPSGECYRRAIVRPAVRPRRDRRVWCLRVPGRPCRAGSRPAGDCSQCPAVGALLRCGVVARGARGPRLMSATFPTRLETRTKESNMCASRGAVRNPQGVVKANAGVVRRR